MQQRYKLIFSTALIASLGIGVFLVVKKYNKNVLQKLRRALDCKNPLRHQHIEVCTNLSDSRKLADSLQLHCSKYPILGFDCEWNTVNGSRKPVALLQLATQNGLCALIRLCTLKTIPPELRSILEDENIIKVGIAPSDDAKYLARDYGVRVASTLDLRYLAQSLGYEPSGLARLSDAHLNVKLSKDWRIRCSDWEANPLTDEQTSYAAADALVAIELFKVFHRNSNLRLSYRNKMKVETYIASCRKYLNLWFNQSKVSQVSSLLSSTKQTYQEVKISKRPFSTRASVFYTNCFLQAPDGKLLATIDRRKADWYVTKSLAVEVAESPYTVRLNFEPKAKPVGSVGEFYKLPKENRCVVCGVSESFNRKNIVPREYRKHFPEVMKSHSSHDVVLLCPKCHLLSNKSDMNVRLKLAESCNAPFRFKDGCLPRVVQSVNLKQRKSYAKALYLNGDSIPIDRKEFLQSELLKHFPPDTVLTEELLKNTMEMNISEVNEEYIAHGSKVVEHFKNSNGLIELETIWREHFMRRMNPKYLPDLWSLNHTADRLNIRRDEGRIEEIDLKYAGLEPINMK